jgi:hypothetical protein
MYGTSLHGEVFTANGLKWPPVLSAELAAATEHLPQRPKELVFLLEDIAKSLKKQNEAIWDVNYSVNFLLSEFGKDSGICPCLVSTAKPWWRKLRRDMCGREALGLQGLGPAEFDTFGASYPNPLLLDFAGNAFNAFVLVALVTRIVAGIDWTTSLEPTVKGDSALDDIESSESELQGSSDDEASDEADDSGEDW